jgi:CheY-like chemotaxis protein
VLVLDVQLPPGQDGPETLAALRTLNPDVGVVFMSGDPGNYSEEQLLALGAVQFLPKPFGPAELARAVRLAL